VTLITTILGIYNALIRPLMGIAYDKTRTRWGKARPYAMFAPVFYYGATALLFSARLFFNNDNTADPGKIIFVFVMMMIRDTFSLVYKLPTDNYTSLMSPNPQDRIAVGLWQEYARRWSGDFLAMMMMPLLDAVKSGVLNVSLGVVFAGFGIFSAFTGVGGNILMAAYCRERIILQPKPAPITKTLFYILKNKYAMRNFLAGLAGGWWSKGGYNWDVVTQLEILGGIFRTAPFFLPRQVAQVVSISFVERFKKFFGGSYRKTVICMRLIGMAVTTVPTLLGLSPGIIGTWWKAGLVFMAADVIVYGLTAPNNVLDNELKREVSDYTEYVTGERPDGSIGILTQWIGKITDPFRALMTIAVFKWSGYDPKIGASQRWTQELVRANATMYSKVFFLFNCANIVPDILGMIPLLFYDLEGQKKAEMYAALNERRALIASDDAMSQEMEAIMGMAAEEQ
jgi:GPH family glycoside/pentoside/hexuronide:cation symporter/probable glucitol transport protein GutA